MFGLLPYQEIDESVPETPHIGSGQVYTDKTDIPDAFSVKIIGKNSSSRVKDDHTTYRMTFREELIQLCIISDRIHCCEWYLVDHVDNILLSKIISKPTLSQNAGVGTFISDAHCLQHAYIASFRDNGGDQLGNQITAYIVIGSKKSQRRCIFNSRVNEDIGYLLLIETFGEACRLLLKGGANNYRIRIHAGNLIIHIPAGVDIILIVGHDDTL